MNNSTAKYGKILDICKRFPKKHKTWGLGTHSWDKQNRLALGLTNRLYYFVFVNLDKMFNLLFILVDKPYCYFDVLNCTLYFTGFILIPRPSTNGFLTTHTFGCGVRIS